MAKTQSGVLKAGRFVAVFLGGLAVCGASLLWLRGARRVDAMVREEFRIAVPPSVAPEGDARFREVGWPLAGVGMQRALYLPPQNGAVVVFVHGSPGSGAGFLPEAVSLAEAGYGALLLDLPGYGGSAGARDWGPSSDRAVVAGLDFLASQPEVDSERLGLFGYSMGSAIACRVAESDARVDALVLLAPFTDLRSQLSEQYRSRLPWMGWVAARAARDCGVRVEALDPRKCLLGVRLELPVLFLGGSVDTVVPPEMVRALAQERPLSEMWLAPGVGHSGFAEVLGDVYLGRLEEFLERAFAESEEEEVRHARR